MGEILLTGATGGTGAVILERLIQDGCSVTAAIRSFSRSKATLEQQYATAFANGQLKFIEIPDMAAKGAFDEPARSATYIMHVAAPITDSDVEKTMIEPGWAYNENILNAASASPSVKRVIITGSLAGVMKIPDQLLSGETFTEDNYNPVTLEQARNDATGLMGYQYAKAFAEKHTWDWVKQYNPKFDVVYLLAPAITGRSIQVGFVPDKNARGGNGAVYRELFDRDAPGSALFPYFMDVDDVADIHIKALSPSINGNRRYLFHAPELMLSNPAANYVREVFPELKDRVPQGDSNATAPPNLSRFDISRSEKAFGMQWKGWKESVVAAVDSIIKNERR